jgi:hypothetical protein
MSCYSGINGRDDLLGGKQFMKRLESRFDRILTPTKGGKTEETYLVIDPGFSEAVGCVTANYEMEMRKLEI